MSKSDSQESQDSGRAETESPFRDRPPLETDVALAILNTGELDVLGRMPWSSNGTFLCDLVPPATTTSKPADAGDTDETSGSDDTPQDQDNDGDIADETSGSDDTPQDQDSDAGVADVTAQAIYKPHSGEQPLWDFPSGLFKREVACFELSRALRWDLVPPTVLRDGPLGPGSLQLFVPCDFNDHYFTLQDEEQYRLAFERLTAFDFMANSTDRKSGHVLLGKDDKIHAIDNGLSFHVEFKLRTVLWDFAGDPIPQDIIDDMASFVTAGPTDELTELLSSLEIDAMMTRARALISEGKFPIDPSGRRWPWPLV